IESSNLGIESQDNLRGSINMSQPQKVHRAYMRERLSDPERKEEWNKKNNRSKQRMRMKRGIWLYEYKSKCKCTRCGESDPICLDFHHVDEKTKKFGISSIVNEVRKSEKEILEEIEKCIVLCAN